MPGMDRVEPIAKKQFVIFYVLDTSGSMAGTPIAMLNQAMRETINAIKETAKRNADADIKVAVLTFSIGSEWITKNKPVAAEDLVFDDLKAGGLTALGAALDKLNDKLDNEKFMKSNVGNLPPVILFMTDGHPTDDPTEYNEKLGRLRENRWFKKAYKLAFALGPDADVDVMADLVGSMEGVLKTNNLEVFAKALSTVSKISVRFCSQSSNVRHQNNVSTNTCQMKDEPTGGKNEPINIDIDPENLTDALEKTFQINYSKVPEGDDFSG